MVAHAAGAADEQHRDGCERRDLGRVVARPGELQVGIVLAVIGAPFFIALVRRRKTMAL